VPKLPRSAREPAASFAAIGPTAPALACPECATIALGLPCNGFSHSACWRTSISSTAWRSAWPFHHWHIDIVERLGHPGAFRDQRLPLRPTLKIVSGGIYGWTRNSIPSVASSQWSASRSLRSTGWHRCRCQPPDTSLRHLRREDATSSRNSVKSITPTRPGPAVLLTSMDDRSWPEFRLAVEAERPGCSGINLGS
jgi:hypothetical protein